MSSFGKKARVALVYLTVLLTLLGGSPHVRCLCPSGRIKPYCLSFILQGVCGDCGGVVRGSGRCGAAQPKTSGRPASDESRCCACHTRRPAAADVGGCTAALAAAGCIKTLVMGADFATTSVEPLSDCFHLLPVGLPPAGTGDSLSGRRCRPLWMPHLLPPPTDLITTLQRLTV